MVLSKMKTYKLIDRLVAVLFLGVFVPYIVYFAFANVPMKTARKVALANMDALNVEAASLLRQFDQSDAQDLMLNRYNNEIDKGTVIDKMGASRVFLHEYYPGAVRVEINRSGFYVIPDPQPDIVTHFTTVYLPHRYGGSRINKLNKHLYEYVR